MNFDEDLLDAVELTPDEHELITREVKGQGGFQTLIRHLQVRLEGRSLAATYTELERMIRYCSKYGGGGFQARLLQLGERIAALNELQIVEGELALPSD